MLINEFKLNRSYNKSADLKITLKPTYKCNQMCSFCKEYNNGFKSWGRNTIDILCEKLKELPKKFEKIFIYYYGGEPTLFKHLEYLTEKLFDTLGDRDVFIQCQTNGSISMRRIKNFNFKNFEFCTSYHLNKQTVDEFIQKLLLMREMDILGFCFINTDRENEIQFIDEFNRLASVIPDKIKMRFTFLPGAEVNDYEYFTKKYPYLNNFCEEQFEFKVNGGVIGYDEFYNKRLNNFKNMKCECTSKSLVVNWDETVFHCDDETRILLTNHNKKMLYLKDLDLSTFFKPFKICSEPWCHRGLEFSKYKLTRS